METGDIGSTEGDSAVPRSVPNLQTTNPDRTRRRIQITAVLLCYLPFVVGLVRMFFRYFDTVNPTEWLSELLVPAAGYYLILIVSVCAASFQARGEIPNDTKQATRSSVRSSCYRWYAALFFAPVVLWHLVYVLTTVTDGMAGLSVLLTYIPFYGMTLALYLAFSELTQLIVLKNPFSHPLKLLALNLLVVAGSLLVMEMLWISAKEFLPGWYYAAVVAFSLVPLVLAWWMYRATLDRNTGLDQELTS